MCFCLCAFVSKCICVYVFLFVSSFLTFLCAYGSPCAHLYVRVLVKIGSLCFRIFAYKCLCNFSFKCFCVNTTPSGFWCLNVSVCTFERLSVFVFVFFCVGIKSYLIAADDSTPVTPWFGISNFLNKYLKIRVEQQKRSISFNL